jgi:uncharacterized protein YndB with AHSA1/START domain
MPTRRIKPKAAHRARRGTGVKRRAPKRIGAPKRVAKRAARGPAGFAPPVSDDAVRGRTGRSWPEWIRVLDRAGARSMSHAEIAKYLAAAQRVPSWWSQMVTVGYERARGRRVKNQRTDGHSVSVSRTLEVPAAAVFRAFHDARQRARWLNASRFTIRTARAPHTLRVTWEDGRSHLLVTCTPKGARRSRVEIEHTRLGNAAAAARMKARWAKSLEQLRVMLAR